MRHRLAGGEARRLKLLWPHPADLHVEKVKGRAGTVPVTARSRAAEAACHRCGLPCAQLDGWYRWRLHDLRVIGLAARFVLAGLSPCSRLTADPQHKIAKRPRLHAANLAMLATRWRIGTESAVPSVSRQRDTEGMATHAGDDFDGDRWDGSGLPGEGYLLCPVSARMT